MSEKQCDKVHKGMGVPGGLTDSLTESSQAKKAADAKQGGHEGQNSDIQASWRMRAGSALDDLRPQKQEQYDSLNIQVVNILLAQVSQRLGRVSIALHALVEVVGQSQHLKDLSRDACDYCCTVHCCRPAISDRLGTVLLHVVALFAEAVVLWLPCLMSAD